MFIRLCSIILLLNYNLIGQNLGNVTVFNTENSGISYNQVNCIELDEQGHIWIGTPNGLSIFNETENSWINPLIESQSSLTNIISSLEFHDYSESYPGMFLGTNQGIIYGSWESEFIGSIGEGISWYLEYGSTCSPNSGIIKSILYHKDSNQLWVGSTDGLCIEGLVEEDDWILQNTNTGFYSNNITSIQINDNSDMIGIGSMNGGLTTYNDAFNFYYSSNSDILDNTVFDLAFDQNNNIITCTPQAGLGVLTENGSWIWFNTINSSLPTNSLKNIVIDNNNDFWITTLENGIIHYTNNTFYNYTTENSSLPDNKINCLRLDDNNNLWLGGDTAGLIKVIPQSNNTAEFNIKETNIHPTIFKNNITINCSEKTKIKIVNSNFQTISFYELNTGNHIINTSAYPNGIYFITCQTPHGKKTHKLFKPF